MGILLPEIINFLGITSDNFCYCGSNKKYGECCMNKIHDPWMTKEEFNAMNPKNYNGILPPSLHKNAVFDLTKECLLCNSEAVKSHTISRNWMKNVFHSDFVSTVLPDKYGNLMLTKVPINQAGSIPIRCSHHDNEIFKSIDNDIDINNKHHLSLLAYRALGREYKLLQSHLKVSYTRIYHFKDLEYQTKHIEYYKRSIEVFKLTKYVEQLILNGSDKGLSHKIFKLGKIHPIFLSSAIHLEREKQWQEEKHVAILSIITLHNIGYFIISFKSDQTTPKNFYRKVSKIANGNNFIPFLNDFIGKNCENIICDENRSGELIQTPEDGKLYENGAHEYIKLL